MSTNFVIKKTKPKLAIFASGSGTTLDYFISHSYFDIQLVISNRHCKAIEISKAHRIPYYIIQNKHPSTKNNISCSVTEYKSNQCISIDAENNSSNSSNLKKNINQDQALLEILKNHTIDFIILAGYLQCLNPSFLSHYVNRVINSHPSLLPKYGGKGMYGIHVHRAVIQAQEKKTGVTIHYVNEEYDKGKIIDQKEIEISKTDTAESLQEKIKSIEKPFYAQTILKIWNQL